MITNTSFLQQIKNIYNPRWLESVSAKRIAGWVWDYFKQHDEAPGKEGIEKAKIPFRVIPTDRSLTVCEIIDNLLAKAIICVSGDTGMSHLAAALDKDIIALYPDNKNDVLTYEPVRQSTNSSSPWSSDPLSRKYKKFILQNNEFNVRDVFEYAFAKYKEIVG